MKPTQFKGQSIILQKPKGMTDAACGELAILQLDGACISCWKLSWIERFKLLFTGKIWLIVLSGKTQPPVSLSIGRPFTKEQADEVAQQKGAKESFNKMMKEKYGSFASRKVESLLKSGIKPPKIGQSDPRWQLFIERDDYELAIKHGIGFMYGLKLQIN